MSRFDDTMVLMDAELQRRQWVYENVPYDGYGVDPLLLEDNIEFYGDGRPAFNIQISPGFYQKFFYKHGFLRDGYEYYDPRFSNLYYLPALQQWARQYDTDTRNWTFVKSENGGNWYDTGIDAPPIYGMGAWNLSAGTVGANDGMLGDTTIGRLAIAAIIGAPFVLGAMGIGLAAPASGVVEGAVIGDLSGFGAGEFVTSDMVSEALANGVLTAEQAASTLQAIESAAPITGISVPSTENITYTYEDGSTATLNADGSATATPATDPGVSIGNSVGDKVLQTIKDKAVSTGVNQVISTGVKAVTGSTAPGQQNIQRAYTGKLDFPWFLGDPVATPDQAKPATSPLLIFGLIFIALGGA